MSNVNFLTGHQFEISPNKTRWPERPRTLKEVDSGTGGGGPTNESIPSAFGPVRASYVRFVSRIPGILPRFVRFYVILGCDFVVLFFFVASHSGSCGIFAAPAYRPSLALCAIYSCFSRSSYTQRVFSDDYETVDIKQASRKLRRKLRHTGLVSAAITGVCAVCSVGVMWIATHLHPLHAVVSSSIATFHRCIMVGKLSCTETYQY